MKQDKRTSAFGACLFLCLGSLFAGLPSLRAGDEGFSVKFSDKKALFSGAVDSEETAQILAKAIKQALPNIEVVNEGIHIDERVEMPPLLDLKSILAEIALSTHDGRFSINNEHIIVSGLTDSAVTSTALMIRLRPIRGRRQIISHICIVPTEDLPDIPIFLADGKTVETLIDLDPKPTPETSFEIPGILPAKLISLIQFFSNQGPPKGTTTITATPENKLRAVPITMIKEGGQPSPATAIALSPIRSQPVYEELRPVLFSRNTFLLQANQESVVQETIKLLQDPRIIGKRLILRAMKPQAGSATFNDWLCQRRSEEVKTMLIDRGIAAGSIKTEIVNSKKTADTGEVRVFVVIPPPPPPQQPQQTPGSESPSATEPAATENKPVTIPVQEKKESIQAPAPQEGQNTRPLF